MRILGISGSLRRDSHNMRLLQAAGELLPADAELVLLDADLLRAIPAFDEDLEAETQGGDDIPAVRSLRETIAQADAVLFATPEYNGSIPGTLKNALDWVSRPAMSTVLRGKQVAVVGASTGMFGAVWAQAELRKVLQTIGAKVVDRELPLMQAHDQFNPDGTLAEEDLRRQLAEHVAELVETAQPARIAA
jgi:chromate reductase